MRVRVCFSGKRTSEKESKDKGCVITNDERGKSTGFLSAGKVVMFGVLSLSINQMKRTKARSFLESAVDVLFVEGLFLLSFASFSLQVVRRVCFQERKRKKMRSRPYEG